MNRILILLGFAGLATLGSPSAFAGTFSLPHFVTAGQFSLGIEPELTLTSGAGLAATAKFTQGISDLLNVTGILGTGGGPRKFRVGASSSFDFFPDIEGQPGIGIAAQGIWYRLADATQFDITGIPYIHKSFMTNKSEIEPFLSVPFGWGFSNGSYKQLTTLAIGSMFKSSENVRYVMEFGMAINNTESYLSGGIVYYH